MRLVLVNVRYSANLGDGLLAECLEHALRSSSEGLSVSTIDLAGRLAYGHGGISNRRRVLALLELAPPPVRRWLVGQILTYLVDKRLRPRWRDELAGADAAVVGGGNLLADADLNFPLKIAGAMAECAKLGVAVAVHGVGVSDNWSKRARELFLKAFGDVALLQASVRDERSQAIWDRSLASAGLPAAVVCHDPAVLTSRFFPVTRAAGGGRSVAIGVTSPLALRYHGGRGPATTQAFSDWLMSVTQLLTASGWRVTFFTNGSGEDIDFLEALKPKLQAIGQGVAFEAPFKHPGELATFVGRQDFVLAHRLHACIAAYSYAVPHIGFRWDPKLDSFFESVGRRDFVLTAGDGPAEELMAMMERALAVGIDPETHKFHLDCTAEEIGQLAARLESLSA